MKAWRARTSSGGGFAQASGVVTAHVVSVTAFGGTSCTWTFDRVVTSIGDVAGMTVDGEGGDGSVSGLGTMVVIIDYANPHSAGETWLLDAVTAALIFSPAASIANDNGITV